MGDRLRDLGSLPLEALWDELVDPAHLRALLRLARDEDLGEVGDVTGQVTVAAGTRASAQVVLRRDGVVAGLRAVPILAELFGFDGLVEPLVADGARGRRGDAILRLEGDLRALLALERTMLNLLGRMSGIATLTARFVEAVAGTPARVCDTRKTTPGLRGLEKYAVRCGGGSPHRVGLHDALLVKDNHLVGIAPGELADAVQAWADAARRIAPLRFVEIEVDSLEQFQALLALPRGVVDMVLLDNMPPALLAQAVALRGESRMPLLEASGGVGLDSVRAVAESGVDRISVGALTHSAPALDLGLDRGPQRTGSPA